MNDRLLANASHHLHKQLQLSRTANHSRQKRSMGVRSAFWQPGQTLQLSFIGTPEYSLKDAIVNTAKHWLKYANLQFELVDDNDDQAEIRIQTDGAEGVNYSLLGAHALIVDGASMALATTPADSDFELIVLHEFGHALGMDHEHQHPHANIPWDLEALRQALTLSLTEEGHAPEELEAAVGETLITQYLPEPEDGRFLLPYDKKSIMHYAVSQAHTIGDWQIGENVKLSKKDKKFMRQVYPGRCRKCF